MPFEANRIKESLLELGQKVRSHRKSLGISMVATAESAGVSRVTLHRIERGEASVAMGGYMSVLSVLNLKIDLKSINLNEAELINLNQKLPKKIMIDQYKQLKRIAWQIKKGEHLSPKETLDLYERNWRHIKFGEMDAKERELVQTLLACFGRERLLV